MGVGRALRSHGRCALTKALPSGRILPRYWVATNHLWKHTDVTQRRLFHLGPGCLLSVNFSLLRLSLAVSYVIARSLDRVFAMLCLWAVHITICVMSGTEILAQRATLKQNGHGGTSASDLAATQTTNGANGHLCAPSSVAAATNTSSNSSSNRVVVHLVQNGSASHSTGQSQVASGSAYRQNGYNAPTASVLATYSQKTKEVTRRHHIRDDEDGHLIYRPGDRVDRCTYHFILSVSWRDALWFACWLHVCGDRELHCGTEWVVRR